LIVVVLGRHELPEPFTTTALLAAGAIANTVTSAIAGSSNFSRFTEPLLIRPIWNLRVRSRCGSSEPARIATLQSSTTCWVLIDVFGLSA